MYLLVCPFTLRGSKRTTSSAEIKGACTSVFLFLYVYVSVSVCECVCVWRECVSVCLTMKV